MVVADEDPPRKRSRLSLKAKKGENTPLSEDPEPPLLDSAGTVPQGPQLKSDEEMADCSPPVIDLTESDLPCDQQVVPPVASMENLGNTCFLNSVLEVLRYTPCFLEGLEELYRHIVYLEKIKSSDVVQSSEEVRKGPVLTWDLVKNMFKMYKKMEKREEMFTQFANADVTSMAVKPDKVLDVIRGFNPMFEGNMQHDAQEVLRCLLCYLEDSERELHSDYASILALDPSLLKTPGPHAPSLAQDSDRQGSNAIMEKFLAAGKSRHRRGKSAAIAALKFEQPPSETTGPLESGDNDRRPECSSTRFRRSSPALIKPDILDTVAGGGCKEKNGPDCPPDAKKRKFQPARLRKVAGREECDEVDSIGRKPQSAVSPDVAATASKEEEEHEEEEEGGGGGGQTARRSRHGVRRSARRRVQNKRVSEVVSSNNGVRGKRTCRQQAEAIAATATTAAEKGEGDTKHKLFSEAVKTSEKSADRGLVNGDHREAAARADKSQPTIPSMFSSKGGRYRRLGMRGRVLHTPCNPGPFSPQLSPRSPEPSPEPRRSPRKVGGTRPVAVPVALQKQNGVVTPSVSPARPDEFPSQAVSRTTSTDSDQVVVLDCADWSPFKSPPASAQVWDVEGLDSPPRKTFLVKQGGEPSASTRTEAEDTDLTDDGFQDELPDLGPPSDMERGLDRLHLGKGVASPVKSKLEKMLASRTKSAGLTSPVKPSGLSSPRLRNAERKDSPMNPHPSKLMIKLQKCDHLCNAPTISASAALKALKAPTNTCRKMVYEDNDTEDGNNNEQDSDEDEVSLGTKSSFKSVPLKSVCVKVEKCDMVCDSPEKSVSARFATNCLARQRAQRFNIIEKLFQGTMMMRTKCLECERCTERKESFLDVSVPLCAEGSAGSDSESDEEKDSSLLRLMRAFTDVEHLRDDNKYYCEQCFRYVEAERSLHYEALPNILTVHLKRFSATGMFGCLSKINDYVTVPLLLSCMRYKCPKPCVRPDHRYTLYAIVTHAGSTISAGHYLSYIKVRPNAVGHETLSTYLDNSPAKKSNSGPLNDDDDDTALFDSSPAFQQPASSPDPTDSPLEKQRRDSPLRKPPSHSVSERGDCSLFTDSREERAGGQSSRRMTPAGEGEGQNRNGSQTHQADYHWLECDDETIHILSEKEFHGRLLEKEGALRGTPYVLFYHRLDTWKAK